MILAPGTRLGTYEILGQLGAGGMGEVFRAMDTRLGREVAIKVLPAGLAADEGRRGRFEREAQILASLSHPNIGGIFGLEEFGGAQHLVLELVSGETLALRLERGALPAREALAVGVQVAAAIEAAHERGVVHRDLKPGNVMITPSGVVKVLDFGLAKGDVGFAGSLDSSTSPTVAARPDATVAGTLVGTVAYMSPEQARGHAVDRRSDIWSFACVLFECFMGRPAFTGATASDLIARILEREPDFGSTPGNMPPRVRDILRRCFRKDADDRPRDIRDVRLELSDLAAGSEKGEVAREKSIAVLPFENLSGADDEYFADGITDEILNALVSLGGLRVAARSSCFAFKGRREDLRVVGEKLDVATVLEGSVRRSGNRLRITVQLVNAADGYQLWSERFDREMTDVFEVQDEIAAAIAGRLRVALHGDADRAKGRHGTTNLEAYELLLKGRAFQLRRGRFLFQAITCFERAIALDPQYAEPLAWLADSYRLLGTFGVLPSGDVMPKAKQLALQALALDPEVPEADATLADIELQYERNWPLAAASWERALTLDPRHVRGRCERALWGHGFGVFTAEEAESAVRLALANDPFNAWAISQLSFMLGFAGRHDESLREADRAFEIDPESFLAQWSHMRARAWGGDHAGAIAVAPALLATTGRTPWVLGMLAWSHARSGNAELARAAFDEMEARSRLEFVAPYWLAVAADAAGLHEEAMRYAERAVVERDPMFITSRHMPMMEGVKADARFAALAKAVWG